MMIRATGLAFFDTMHGRALRGALLAAGVLAAACSDAPSSAPSAPAAPTSAPASTSVPAAEAPGVRARAAAQTLKAGVMGALTKAVATSGAAGAIDVCGGAAAAARDAVTAPDLRIGRTSSKLRNPANTAPAWVAPILADLEKAAPAARAPREVSLPAGGLGYVEPLVVMPLCLQCHGQSVADDVRAALAAKYLSDQATGYAEGDLRGVVWVQIGGAQ